MTWRFEQSYTEQTDQKVEMQAATSIQARENNVYMKVWRYRHRIEHYGSAGGHRKGTRLRREGLGVWASIFSMESLFISQNCILGVYRMSAPTHLRFHATIS